MTQNGGEIKVHSDGKGKGSIFTFDFKLEVFQDLPGPVQPEGEDNRSQFHRTNADMNQSCLEDAILNLSRIHVPFD